MNLKDNNKKIMTTLYALSTCIWCKKTKKLLDKLGAEYKTIYLDLLEDDERGKIKKEIIKWNPRFSFPTLVINNEKCIIGFKEDKIKEAFKI